VLAPALAVSVLACREEATSLSAPESVTALEIMQTAELSFRQVSRGTLHTCGVTTDDRA
jgi:hypothetical protein